MLNFNDYSDYTERFVKNYAYFSNILLRELLIIQFRVQLVLFPVHFESRITLVLALPASNQEPTLLVLRLTTKAIIRNPRKNNRVRVPRFAFVNPQQKSENPANALLSLS